MNVTLRQLQVFESVARLASYTRAAEELHLTQPAVSMQVRQLEENLGVALFEQIGRRAQLTPAGEEVLRYARSIAGQLEEMQQVVAAIKGARGGRLRVSAATTANYFIARLLAVFSRRYPGVEIRLDVTNRESLLHQLAENTVDMVVMGRPPMELDVEAGAFMENPLVVVAPPEHPLARTKDIALRRLQDEVFLVREPGSGTRIAMERFFEEHGIRVRTGMEVGSNEAIKQSVQAGLGLGLLSRYTLALELSLGRLVELDVRGFPIRRHWHLVHRRRKRLSPIAEAFKAFMLEEAAAIVRQEQRVEAGVGKTRKGLRGKG
jgi:DNA-binding transcriptional LysR family regulator